MSILFDRIYSNPRDTEGVLIHIGAGLCSELSDYYRCKFERICLIEPNPALATCLMDLTKTVANVRVLNCTLADSEGVFTFYRTNNPRFDSLRMPTRLIDHFPNIKVVSEESVSAVSLSSVVSDSDLRRDRHNVLILDLKGAECDILDQVAPGLLQLFSWILVKTSVEDLYDRNTQLEDFSTTLQNACFDNIHTERMLSPFCTEVFERNDAEISLLIANEKISEMEDQFQKLDENRVLCEKLLAKTQSDLDDLRLRYGKKLESERSLIELISELKSRLQVASEYYSRLGVLYPELLVDK